MKNCACEYKEYKHIFNNMGIYYIKANETKFFIL